MSGGTWVLRSTSTVKHALGLLVATLAVATCGLVYELLAGAVASWVLGDSVTQFSTVIGTYLAALGLGSYLSRHVERGLARRFVQVELAVALVGGLSTPALFLSFAQIAWFRTALYASVVILGTLVGLEVPLLIRIVNEQVEFRSSVARVLSFDYAGSLVGSLFFSLLAMPHLGPVRTALAFGIVNALVALWSTVFLRESLGRTRGLRAAALIVIALLGALLARSETLIDTVESGSDVRTAHAHPARSRA